MNEINFLDSNKITNININEDEFIIIGNFLNKKIENERYFNENNNNQVLSYYFYYRDIYNEKGTKLNNKDNYLSLINIINDYIDKEEEFFIVFFENIKVSIFKVIINGYINFDLNNGNNKIKSIIKKIIPLFFDKTIFYYIYNKLSKIFRTFILNDNKDILFMKFIKLLDVWQLLYKVKNISKANQNYLSLIGQNFLLLDIFILNKKTKIKSINITIEFCPFFFLSINKKIKDFCFLKAYYNFNEAKEVKINHIQLNKDEKLEKIQFIITNSYYRYNINEECNLNYNDKKNIFMSFLLDNNAEIEKIEILKNFIGGIKNIKILVEHDDSKTEFEIKVNESQDKIKDPYIIIQNPEMKINEERFKLNFEPKTNDFICCKNLKEIFYEDIRYYNGMESFIPIFKIIKYFIEQFPDNSEKLMILNQKIIEIVNVIINNICYSEKNYLNFKKILVPLLGALAEINHVLPEKYQKDLYNNQVFSSLYILIGFSSVPMALKKSFEIITGLNEVDKLILNFDELILDKEFNFICYEWYSIILYIYIGFVLIVFNDYKKVPKNIITQLINLQENEEKNFYKKEENNSLIKLLLGCFNYICDIKEEENNIVKENEKISNLSEFLRGNNKNYSEFYLKNILSILKALLNIVDFNNISFEDKKENDNNININDNIINDNIINDKNIIYDNSVDNNNYIYKYKNLVDSLEEIFKNNNFFNEKIKDSINKEFKDFSKHQKYLVKIFGFENNHGFELESELVLKEFIDYHREYHKLMKNIFIFNRFWSDKKLFFNEEKRKLLKYKYINYYTTNFQRPIIFPVIDYKYSYPPLTDFEIKDDFYLIEENKDDYKFTLCCPELDEFCIKYENQIKNKIEKDFIESIHIYNVCLVKRTHHIKGRLYILNKNGLIKKFLFHSFPKDIANNTSSCNVSEETQHYNHKREKICYGEIFVCPEKDMNIKIFIDINDVRLILQRIYFYRKTAIEIFTDIKSYYFNFAEDFKIKNAKKGENYCERFINMMGYYYKTEFFPIKIKQNLMGYSRQFCQIIKKYSEEKSKKNDLMEIENKYMSVIFDHWKPNFTDIEFSTFDMIIDIFKFIIKSFICRFIPISNISIIIFL